MNEFAQLGVAEPFLRALEACGYDTPTPIQEQAIPPLLQGRDLLGCAQTGTGKTAAFGLPVLQHLGAARGRRPRALILTPTRELAAQIGEALTTYGAHTDLRHRVIFGGVGQGPQVRALTSGLDILVACPGRLLDLYGQGHIDLTGITHFVLDEADRMLDMGFIHDVRKVLKVLPNGRQNLLFSATMPKAIVDLAGRFLDDPVQIEVTPERTTVEAIQQRVLFLKREDKPKALAAMLRHPAVEQAIVFSRTKHGANRLVKRLDAAGIPALAIHGNKSQNARTKALTAFRSGEVSVLVATDVASRGIDIDGVTHVFNYDLPNEPESYVHRIGRTGRAGRSGVAIAFCDESEVDQLRDIERLTGERVPRYDTHAWHDDAIATAKRSVKKPKQPRPPRRGSPRSGSGRARR